MGSKKAGGECFLREAKKRGKRSGYKKQKPGGTADSDVMKTRLEEKDFDRGGM